VPIVPDVTLDNIGIPLTAWDMLNKVRSVVSFIIIVDILLGVSGADEYSPHAT
jgi:hypothetical protein